MITLRIEWREPQAYWAEDFAPSFMGPPGFYVMDGTMEAAGPFATREDAARKRRYLLSLIAQHEG